MTRWFEAEIAPMLHFASTKLRSATRNALLSHARELAAGGKGMAEIERSVKRYAERLIRWEREAMTRIERRVALI